MGILGWKDALLGLLVKEFWVLLLVMVSSLGKYLQWAH